MPHLTSKNNIEANINESYKGEILLLVADENTKVILSDLPVWGANLTFREDIADLANSIVYPSMLIGWIDCSQLTKLACLNQQHYFDAQHFIKVDSHQLFFAQTVKVHSVNTDLKKSKSIMSFSLLPTFSKPTNSI